MSSHEVIALVTDALRGQLAAALPAGSGFSSSVQAATVRVVAAARATAPRRRSFGWLLSMSRLMTAAHRA